MNEIQTSGERTSVRLLDAKASSRSARCRGDRGRLGFFRGDRGATAVEYAIMVSLIAVVIISAVTLFGQHLINLFDVPSSAL